MDQSVRQRNIPIPIIIIGCGFGGMALAIELKKAGMNDFVILERAERHRRRMARQYLSGRGLRRGLAVLFVFLRSGLRMVDGIRTATGNLGLRAQGGGAPRHRTACAFQHRSRPRRHLTKDPEHGPCETADGARLTTPILVSAVGLFNHANIPEHSRPRRLQGRRAFIPRTGTMILRLTEKPSP